MSLEQAKKLTDLFELKTLDLESILNKKIKSLRVEHINDYISPSPQLVMEYTDGTFLIIGGGGTTSPHPKYLKYIENRFSKQEVANLLSLQPSEDSGDIAMLYYDDKEFYFNVFQDDSVTEYPQIFSKK